MATALTLDAENLRYSARIGRRKLRLNLRQTMLLPNDARGGG